MIIHVNKDNFQKEVIESSEPVIVDFFAEWCGPCKMLGPILEEIATENQNLKIVKINVDEEQDLATEFRVMSIPTIFVFDKGTVKTNAVGFKSKQEIIDMTK